MEFKGLTSASHMSLPEAGYGSEEGYVGSEISGAVSGVTTPGASRLQASELQQRSTTMQRLHRESSGHVGVNLTLRLYKQWSDSTWSDDQYPKTLQPIVDKCPCGSCKTWGYQG